MITLDDFFYQSQHVEELDIFARNLLPCPFCGGEGTFMSCPDDYGDPYLFVVCTECGCHSKALPAIIEYRCVDVVTNPTTKIMLGFKDMNVNSVHELMKIWNTHQDTRKVVEKLTKADAIYHHRKMWHWIAKWTRKLKRKVYKWEYFDFYNLNKIYINCYCCEYDNQFYVSDDYAICAHCPIDWGNAENRCEIGDSFYNQWLCCAENDWERAAELADMIAELPERREKKQCL